MSKTIAVKLFHLFLFCSMMDGEYGITAFYGSIIIIDLCTIVRRNVTGWHILNRCFPWARTPIVIASIRQIFQFPQQTIIIIIFIFIIILTTPTLFAIPTLRKKQNNDPQPLIPPTSILFFSSLFLFRFSNSTSSNSLKQATQQYNGSLPNAPCKCL